MPLMDEFKEEREKIKDASPEKKWKYFKDYYLKYVIAGGIILLVLIIFVVDMLTKKENMMTVMFVNFADQGTTTSNIEMPFTNEYLENPKRQEITVETNIFIPSGKSARTEVNYTYEDQQRFSMLLMAGEIDLMVSDEDFIMDLAAQEYVLTLDRVFTEDELKPYTDRIVYYNNAPIAIRMDDNALINENLKYKGGNAEELKVCAAFSSLKRLDMAKRFLKYMD